MSVLQFIATRHLRSRHNFGIISFTTLLSIIGLMLGVASLNVISSFSDGFSHEIRRKLAAIDGHIRITKYESFEEGNLPLQEYLSIQDTLMRIDGVQIVFPYIEKRAMIRNGNATEGVILYGVPDSTLNAIFQINEYAVEGNTDQLGIQGLLMGDGLANVLDCALGDPLVIFDLERSIFRNELSAKPFNLSGIFKSGFVEYDKLLAFVSLEAAAKLYELEDAYTGIIVNINNTNRTAEIDESIIGAIGSYPYLTSTWEERHATLFDWLNIYDLPIKLVLIFITLVAVFNISSTLWMVISEKIRDIGILQTIGFSQKSIRRIFLLEGFIIGVMGALSGLFLSIIFLFLQSHFKFIALSSDVYFLDYLPVHWSLENLIIFPAAALILSLLAAVIPVRMMRKIRPAEAVRYE